MQTLGLDPVPVRADGRLKSLFWPSVTNDADVDYLTTQGFWICFLLATGTFLVSLASGAYSAILDAIFFYLAGAGVRRRSRVAAMCLFTVYFLGAVIAFRISYAGGGFGITVRLLFSALLLANVRAVWLASKWRGQGGAEESPAPLSETLADKLSDKMPATVWPMGRFVFYAFAFLEIAAMSFVLFRLMH